MLILLLLFFLFFPNKVFAVPTVVINSVPDVVTAGTTFPITFTVNEASSSATYCYKFFGGIGSDVYAITSDENLSYNSGWIHFPQITLNPSTSNVFNGYAFVDSNTSTNTLNLKIKIALTSNTTVGITSPNFYVDVVALPPTLIPTNTPVPTTTPTPTKIPTPTIKPTATPTINLNRYDPSTEATISAIIDSSETISPESPTDNPSPIPTSVSILGETTTTKKNFIPLILIILGGLFLLAPLIIAKIKSKSDV